MIFVSSFLKPSEHLQFTKFLLNLLIVTKFWEAQKSIDRKLGGFTVHQTNLPCVSVVNGYADTQISQNRNACSYGAKVDFF